MYEIKKVDSSSKGDTEAKKVERQSDMCKVTCMNAIYAILYAMLHICSDEQKKKEKK